MNAAQKALIKLPKTILNMVKILTEEGFNLSDYLLDHACWRCKNNLEYNNMCQAFDSIATAISKDTIISGRRITTFKLHTAIKINNIYTINIIEIPDYKEGSVYNSGWEHIEFTVNDINDFCHKYHDKNINTKGLKSLHHPSVSYRISKDKNVKFNNLLLSKKIELENNSA